MKKILFLLAIISIVSVNYVQAQESVDNSANYKKAVKEIRQQREVAFEKRLGLSDEQKAKARELRKSGHEKLRPVVEEIKLKKQEAKMIKMSRMAVQMQEEKLAVIDKELKVLEKKAHDIRKQNMKDFESILTRQQRKTLKEMKNEGRKRYQAEHPAQMQFKMPQANFKR